MTAVSGHPQSHPGTDPSSAAAAGTGSGLFADLVAAYPRREPRTDLRAVAGLRAAAGVAVPARSLVVVGTNGKTSVATYLERLLRAAGLSTGLTVSPHIERWTERVLLDGDEIAEARLAERLRALHAIATRLPGSAGLRFFDLLTLAAAAEFSAHGAGVAVFEAGIGGRLDAVRCLRAPLVVLTGVALDHTELLGATREAILEEKLLAAPPGAVVVAPRLAAALVRRAETLAGGAGLAALRWVDTGDGDYRARNLRLARAAAGEAARLWGLDPSLAEAPIDERVAGRLQRLHAGGVPVLLDAAHNEEGWAALLAAAPPGACAVVSVPADRAPAPLAALLATAGVPHAVATCARPGQSLPAAELASALAGAGIPATAVVPPGAAVRAGLGEARRRGAPLAVFGSSYLLAHALAALERGRGAPSRYALAEAVRA